MIVVRRAVPEDTEAVARLEADCLGGDAWSAGLVREGVAGALPTVVYLVAEAGGAVVGHTVVSVAGDTAELQRIAVTETFRRRGVATELLAGVLRVAGGTEAERLLLEVREDNSGALAFYTSHGFAEMHRRRRYYEDGATAVVLHRGVAEH